MLMCLTLCRKQSQEAGVEVDVSGTKLNTLDVEIGVLVHGTVTCSRSFQQIKVGKVLEWWQVPKGSEKVAEVRSVDQS